MDQPTDKKRHHSRVASLVPGRVRIKLLHPESRDPEAMQGLKHNLESQEGVHSVRVNPASGSVVVHYDRSHHTTAGILSLLEDLDIVIEAMGKAADFKDAEGANHNPETTSFLRAIKDLNQRIRSVTGVPVDLKIVLPLLFLGAGIWSIGRKGLMIESVPGWLFLWFAFDMFVKLHPTRR